MSTELLSSNDFWEYALAFEEFHSLFYKFWSLGKPNFTTEFKTAAITFDPEGETISFNFNPDFWQKITKTERLFVIAHECLHVIFNHPFRTLGATDRKTANIAADLVVNHELINSYGFNRDEIDPELKYCWVDTVLPEKNLPTSRSYEFYYNQLLSVNDSKNKELVDDHGEWKDASDLIKYLDKNFTDFEKEEIKKILSKHVIKGGTGIGAQQWTFNGTARPKKKWETVITSWAKSNKLKYLDVDVEQWTSKNRRYSLLSEDLMLPTVATIEKIDKHEKKKKVFFFLDTSYSCWDLKDRFFAAALTLPTDLFDVSLFCFDTKVYETTLASRQAYGGGGTYFHIIEEKVQELCKKGEIYPDAVWIISDGEGNAVTPQYPERWKWFLAGSYPSKTYIHKDSKSYPLKDYE